jgi:GT2 family glycosyltransferase
MEYPLTDIIIPVWNKPVETRNCLVNLINHSPDARFIMVDNGSDRETERMLEEFAEGLDHRAILLRDNVNKGYVRAVNKGLARSDARYRVVVNSTSIVAESWLEPMTSFAADKRDAGIIVPRLVKGALRKPVARSRTTAAPIEADHASFAAMLVTKEAYDIIGGLDEEMDGGLWCLRDLSRRAFRAGFQTIRIDAGIVAYEDDILLGSVERRMLSLQRSIALYRERWGESASFCIHLPKGADMNILVQRLEILQRGARQGHSFTILTHGRLYRELTKAGLDRLHENIRLLPIPVIFEARAVTKALSSDDPTMAGAQPVTGVDGIPFPAGIKGMPFEELEQMIVKTGKEKYGA